MDMICSYVENETSVLGAKLIEGQTVQLEDGTTAFIQASTVTGSESLQPVKLEDGTTAYMTTNLFADTKININSDLTMSQQTDLKEDSANKVA